LNGGGALQWNTFLGAPPGYQNNDLDSGIGITAAGNAYVYVAGSSTASWGSPVRGYQGGLTDAFAAKLNAGTGALVWNTFLGGGGWFEDYGVDVAVDGSGNVYVTGHGQGAWSLPPVSGFKGMADVFATKLDANGNWQWHTFLGSPRDRAKRGYCARHEWERLRRRLWRSDLGFALSTDGGTVGWLCRQVGHQWRFAVERVPRLG
jgi:outer membrane protein assembly factor BamB